MWVDMASSHSGVRALLSPFVKCLVSCVLGLPGHLWGNCVPRMWNYVWMSRLPSISPDGHKLAFWRILVTLWKAVWSSLESHRMGLAQRGRHRGPSRRVQH